VRSRPKEFINLFWERGAHESEAHGEAIAIFNGLNCLERSERLEQLYP
jgi:hypothetical protein